MRASVVFGSLLLAAAAGCMTTQDVTDEGDLAIDPTHHVTPPVNPQQIFASYSDGRIAEHDVFAGRGLVALSARKVSATTPGLQPPKTGGLVSGADVRPIGTDYYFAVFDPNGNQLSTDALACRRIRIGSNGMIEVAYLGQEGGAPCQHLMTADANGGVTVRLAPFDASALSNNGNDLYVVRAAPVAGFDGRFTDAISLRATFAVHTPAEPVCGDGMLDGDEQCDDGNTTDGDGCSSTCTTECDGSSADH